MKKLIVFSSKGGNTKKLAEEIFRQLPDDKDIQPVAQAPNPAGYDVVCVGFWLKGGGPDPDAAEYLKKCNGKLFLFATHGSDPDSNHAKMGMNKAEELAEKATVIGKFSCQGEVPEQVMENAANKEPQPAWLSDAAAAKGHPNDEDFSNLDDALVSSGLKPQAKKSGGSVVDGSHAM